MSTIEIPASAVRFGDALAGRQVFQVIQKWDGYVQIVFMDDEWIELDGATTVTVDRSLGAESESGV